MSTAMTRLWQQDCRQSGRSATQISASVSLQKDRKNARMLEECQRASDGVFVARSRLCFYRREFERPEV